MLNRQHTQIEHQKDNKHKNKYQMTKNLIIIVLVTLFIQTNVYSQTTKPKVTFGGNVNYNLGTGLQKDNIRPFLFFNGGPSAELDLAFVPKKGTTRYKLALGYITGTNDKNAITTYAKENDIVFDSYKFTKTNPMGFSIMASPQFMLFPKSQNKKLPLMWLDLKFGALFSNHQTLQFFQGQTTPSKEIKTNSVDFVYNPTFVVNIIKTKKIFINARAGYSNFGGFTFGVGIAESDCRGAYCYRCPGAGCLPY
jgi:hypothetical protein